MLACEKNIPGMGPQKTTRGPVITIISLPIELAMSIDLFGKHEWL